MVRVSANTHLQKHTQTHTDDIEQENPTSDLPHCKQTTVRMTSQRGASSYVTLSLHSEAASLAANRNWLSIETPCEMWTSLAPPSGQTYNVVHVCAFVSVRNAAGLTLHVCRRHCVDVWIKISSGFRLQWTLTYRFIFTCWHYSNVNVMWHIV